MFVVPALVALSGCSNPHDTAALADDKALSAVREVLSRTYIHGIDENLAVTELGGTDPADLVELLEDPTFERHDNVVAFAGYLGDDATARAIEDFLSDPATTPEDSFEEDRAYLLAPVALGQIARRGYPSARSTLLRVTAHGSDGDVLLGTARSAENPDAYRDDLFEASLRGLAWAGDSASRTRIEDIGAGRVVPESDRDLQGSAKQALEMADGIAAWESGADSGGAEEAAGESGGADAVGTFDVDSRVESFGLSYANHPDVTSPMSDAELDAITDKITSLLGRADRSTDVSCCITAVRSGTGKTFGTSGDGLDIVDTSSDFDKVMLDATARVKVVRQVNYCGGAYTTNTIGCGYYYGDGIMVVRYRDTTNEAMLWTHEYGHNVGLFHNTNSTHIMYGSVLGTNDSVDATECATFHTPSTGTKAIMTDLGTCADGDADMVHSYVDNCSTVSNWDQTDADADGVGDACESIAGTCGDGHIDSGEDCDGSALGSATCTSLGYAGGTLGCASSCDFNTSACTTCNDNDADGYTTCAGDCNDASASIRPGATETCGDGIDQDCSGSDTKCPKSSTGGGPSLWEKSCKNGNDDDGDSLVDCADSDCAGKSGC